MAKVEGVVYGAETSSLKTQRVNMNPQTRSNTVEMPWTEESTYNEVEAFTSK